MSINIKTIALTCVALLAFAGNSILCRLALSDNNGVVIDAASFTSIRLLSGLVFLLALLAWKNKLNLNLKNDFKKGSWSSAFFLFLYATAFSFSYITLETGVGALVLFGSVQVTMILSNLFKGKNLDIIEWFGLLIAFSGLIVLLLPGSSSPPLLGFLLMVISGMAWGFYTLAGRGANNPVLLTTNNFLRTIPFVIVLALLTIDSNQITHKGLMLAIVSGTITSGLGYVVWYSALTNLTIIQAAVVQLSVPIIAGFGGVLFANEVIESQLMISTGLVLSGILIVILGKFYLELLTFK